MNARKFLAQTAHSSKAAAHIAAFLGEAGSAKVLIRDRWTRLRYLIHNVSRWSGRGLNLFGFNVEVEGLDRYDLSKENFLFVCNHMSYLDILVFSSVCPSVFVTSVDMGEVPFLGHMAELGGSLFIERRHRNHVERDLGQMAETLRHGLSVVIFPEGTSSNGTGVLPFKKSLLMSAVAAQRDIIPVCLNYVSIEGEPFNQANADRICWYGDMSFAPHFKKVLELKSVGVKLKFLDRIDTTTVRTREEIAERAHAAISASYLSDLPAPSRVHPPH